ncbi:MAG: ABC transporter ATP-binding protein [Solobacterium sp.]|nr:ABC transporter ATP-binding protein [Solobacterium sp.]
MTDTVLEVSHLTVSIPMGKEVYPAISDVSFSVQSGKITGLVGESGCGKSMTARAIMGLLKPNCRITEGTILFDGKDISHASAKERCDLSGNQMSMIFQEPMTSLNPLMKVGRQVEEALRIHTKISAAEAEKKTVEIFREIGIPDPEKRLRAYPHELSGGLRQRVMIAMAMICHPKLLIADEPTTALDVIVEAQILSLMKQLCESGTGILLISHNPGVIAQVCDDVSIMYAGTIVEQADVYELFDHPMHPYTQGLFSAVHSLSEDRGELDVIPGTVPDITHRPSGCGFCTRCTQVKQLCESSFPVMHEPIDSHRVRCHLFDGKESHEHAH